MTPYLEAFLRFFYPASCGICSILLEIEERGLCAACLEQVLATRLPYGESLDVSAGESVDQAWALFPYESPVRELVMAVKFNRKPWLLDVFTEELRDLALVLKAEGHYDLVVPVPLSRKRLLERHFNPSARLARILGAALNVPVFEDVLVKKSGVPPQSLLTREERLANLYGAFRTRTKALQGKSVLLVDDVLTTGATAEEAARVLKENGAARVELAVLARSPEPATAERVRA
ncbi:MAG TPA: ComF family protein [Verrucomicrobiae bacterium]|jgi:ComF family protein|nr:ComF family protein [Verrucomicrobiae bacterium]